MGSPEMCWTSPWKRKACHNWEKQRKSIIPEKTWGEEKGTMHPMVCTERLRTADLECCKKKIWSKVHWWRNNNNTVRCFTSTAAVFSCCPTKCKPRLLLEYEIYEDRGPTETWENVSNNIQYFKGNGIFSVLWNTITPRTIYLENRA